MDTSIIAGKIGQNQKVSPDVEEIEPVQSEQKLEIFGHHRKKRVHNRANDVWQFPIPRNFPKSNEPGTT